MKTPKAPKPLDPQKVATQASAQNLKDAYTQTAFNRPNQTDAFGNSVSWSQTGTDANGNPIFSQQNSLGGAGQMYAGGLANLGSQYFDAVGNQPDLSSNAAFDKAYGYATANLEPRFDRARQQQETQLRNQGLDPTSEAYKSSMNDLALQQNEARNNLVTGLQGQLFNQGLSARQQQLNELQPGVSFGNVALGQNSSPFAQTGVNGVDLTQLALAQQQQKMQNYQAKLNSQGSFLGGLGSIGASILAAPMTGGGSLAGGLIGGLFK